MWIIGTVTLLVLAATVLAVALLEPEPEGSAVPAPPTIRDADDLRGLRIPLRFRGYDPGTVDALLAAAARELDARPPALREELEDGGGDGAGVLDGGPVADVGEDGDPADRDRPL